jgi:hypothetical protein
MEFDYDKLYFATHYICDQANNLDIVLDDVQLNKVLWYSDTLSYMSRGQPITGTTYKKKPRGPVAANHLKVIKRLIVDERVKRGFAETHYGYRGVIDSISTPEIDSFGRSEIELLDRVLKYVCTEVSTQEISEQSHGDIWKLAEDGEHLPLYTVFAEVTTPPSKQEIADAKKGWD